MFCGILKNMRELLETRKWTLYHLIDPRTGEVRYVGITHSDPRKRLNVHVSQARRRKENTHKANWIREVLNDGHRPLMRIIQEGSGSGWSTAEIEEIYRQRKLSPRLTNYQDGGSLNNFGKTMPEDTRKKISESRKLIRGYKIHPSLLAGRAKVWSGKKRPEFAAKVKKIWEAKRLPEWSKENLVRLYASNLTYSELAKEMKCSKHLISKLLVEYGIPRNRKKHE